MVGSRGRNLSDVIEYFESKVSFILSMQMMQMMQMGISRMLDACMQMGMQMVEMGMLEKPLRVSVREQCVSTPISSAEFHLVRP